jgi:7-keto-8-aminopelargonate synthetase-like enzyme
VLKDKIIALSLGAVANSDARERAKRAAYDWLMASAARRYSTSLPPLAAPAAGASVGHDCVAASTCRFQAIRRPCRRTN